MPPAVTTFAEFAYFFLAFLLGTDHEEVEDGDKSHDHEDAGYSALGCLLKENSVGKHGFYFIIYIQFLDMMPSSLR